MQFKSIHSTEKAQLQTKTTGLVNKHEGNSYKLYSYKLQVRHDWDTPSYDDTTSLVLYVYDSGGLILHNSYELQFYTVVG